MNITEEYIIKEYENYTMLYFLQNSKFKTSEIIEIYVKNKLTTNKKTWTDIEVENLAFLAKYKTPQEITVIINRSINSIRKKAKKNNIYFLKVDRKWTKEDEDLLKDMFGECTYETMSKKLNRSVLALRKKAAKLKLGKMMEKTEYLSVTEIVEILNINHSKVRKWTKLGLNLKKKKVTKNYFYYGITVDDLLLFLKENQDLWDSSELKENIFYKEEEWLLIKKAEDKKKAKKENKIWTNKTMKTALELYKENYSYESIANILGVTKNSVANHLAKFKEERNQYKENTTSQKKLCKELKISETTFTKIWLKKGLVVTRKTLPTRTEIIIDKTELIEFLEKNQELFDATNINKSFLNINEQWFLEKLTTDLQKPVKAKTYLKK